MINYFFNLSNNERLIWVVSLVFINILVGIYVNWRVNLVYKKTNSIEAAVDKMRILMRYAFSGLLIVSMFLMVFLFIPMFYQFHSYDLVITMVTIFTIMIVILLIVQALLNNTMKKIRKIDESQKDGLKKALYGMIISLSPALVVAIVLTVGYSLEIDSIILKIALIVIALVILLLGLGVIISKVYPKLLKAIPLQDIVLENELIELVKATGFKKVKILQWPTKSNKMANAYVSGTKEKVIYISDYLMENVTVDEIKSVIAHELGHLKKNHIRKRAGFTLLGFVLMIVLGSSFSFVNGYFDAEISIYLLLAAIIAVLLGYNTIFMKYIFRVQERQADEFVIDIGIKAEVFGSALIKLYELNNMKKSLNNLDAKFQTHPTVIKRIEYINSYEKIKLCNK